MVQHATSLKRWMAGDAGAVENMHALKDLRRRKLFEWVGFTAYNR